jgi:hypothetical protein
MTTDLGLTTLIEGLDDWVPLVTIYFVAQRSNPGVGSDRLCEIVMETVRDLLDDGLVEAGTVTATSGYTPLRESTAAVLDRIRAAFNSDGDPEMWGYTVWLKNTAAGETLANRAES